MFYSRGRHLHLLVETDNASLVSIPTLKKCAWALARKPSDLWRTCAIFDKRFFISFTGSTEFPSVLFNVFFVACCSYIHGWSAEVKRLHARHDSKPWLGGHLVATRRNSTRRRCTAHQVSRSSSRRADRRGSLVRRISTTRDTPREMAAVGGPTHRDSDRGRPSWDRSDAPRKVGILILFFSLTMHALSFQHHKHRQAIKITVAAETKWTQHFKKCYIVFIYFNMSYVFSVFHIILYLIQLFLFYTI